MASAIIVYGSTTGNTETLAGFIGDGMVEEGVDVTIQNAADTQPQELAQYDIITLGSSTWGDGDLQDDFLSFYDTMEDIKLNGKKGAAFGPGDSSYDNFCRAVDLLEERLKECGAQIAAPALKVDGDVDLAENDAREWGRKVAAAAVSAQ